MNYRLAPIVTVPEIVSELQLSVAEVFRRADELGLDRDHIYVGGFSAGGLLAAQLLGTDWAVHGISEPVLCAGMALSGLFDPKPLVFTSHNRVLGLRPGEARALNVIGHFDNKTPKLGLVACGTDETPEFKDQTRRYAAASRDAGQITRELWIKGRHHYEVVLDFADPSTALSKATRQMILEPGCVSEPDPAARPKR